MIGAGASRHCFGSTERRTEILSPAWPDAGRRRRPGLGAHDCPRDPKRDRRPIAIPLAGRGDDRHERERHRHDAADQPVDAHRSTQFGKLRLGSGHRVAAPHGISIPHLVILLEREANDVDTKSDDRRFERALFG